jgi:hypothetical protein
MGTSTTESYMGSLVLEPPGVATRSPGVLVPGCSYQEPRHVSHFVYLHCLSLLIAINVLAYHTIPYRI